MKSEPALLISGLAGVLSTLAISYGLDLPKEQIVALLSAVQIVLSLVVRYHVSPVGKG
jgi:hypothetical protein